MPVSPTPPDAYFVEVAKAYQQAELEILALIRRRLTLGAELDDLDWATARLAEVQVLRRQAVAVLAKANQAQAKAILRSLDLAYDAGGSAALKDASGYTPARPSAVSSAARTASVRALAGATTGSLAERLPRMLRQMEDDYARVVNDTVARVQAGGVDRRTATGQALQQAYGKGLSMGPNGKMNLPDYVTMATRTGVANASIQGHVDTLAENGLDLVYIQPGPRHCETCDEWANKPLWRGQGPTGPVQVESVVDGKPMTITVYGTLAQAKAAGWGHPNCRCNVGAYIPGATQLPTPRPKWDEDGYQAQQEQRAIERKIREWKTRAALATDSAEVARANAKVKEWQAAQRAHLAANPALKRQFARESVRGTLGPGGIPRPPAGGPGGDSGGGYAYGQDKYPGGYEFRQVGPPENSAIQYGNRYEHLITQIQASNYSSASGYKAINRALRSGNANEALSLQQAVYAEEVAEDMVVRRGLRNLTGIKKMVPRGGTPQDLVGRVFEEKGFMSTSYDPKRMASTAGMEDFTSLPVQMDILVPKGSRGSAMDWNLEYQSHQAEFLLPPGSKLEFLSVEGDGDSWKIVAKLVEQRTPGSSD